MIQAGGCKSFRIIDPLTKLTITAVTISLAFLVAADLPVGVWSRSKPSCRYCNEHDWCFPDCGVTTMARVVFRPFWLLQWYGWYRVLVLWLGTAVQY